MELEDKIKKLEEQFKGLPKVLIKKTLCGDDVNGDITKATDRLREFQQMKNSLFHNPMAVTSATEEFVEELDRNSVAKNCIEEGKDRSGSSPHKFGKRSLRSPSSRSSLSGFECREHFSSAEPGFRSSTCEPFCQ